MGDATALAASNTTTMAQERLSALAVVEDTLDIDRGVLATQTSMLKWGVGIAATVLVSAVFVVFRMSS